ncbi:uncharacterized protein PSANT_06324 [Moesziomyces antarcticus]|uniref:Uncharacterized protein n=1 Tax=Pseudozyma antarctica TaxID=84753 RepID=A0A5C3FW35_PSEA2|nr:uncharacterized protein PSANT_06324 [Moesziomyces antarcticus]
MTKHSSYEYTSHRVVRKDKSEHEKRTEVEAAFKRISKGPTFVNRVRLLADSLDAIVKSLDGFAAELEEHNKLSVAKVKKLREPMRITEESTTRVSTTKTSKK